MNGGKTVDEGKQGTQRKWKKKISEKGTKRKNKLKEQRRRNHKKNEWNC